MTVSAPTFFRWLDAWDAAMGWLDTLCRWAIGAALLGVLAMLLLQVLVRYVLPFPLPWVEEVAVYMSGYVAMIGAAVCLRQGYHLQVDLFSARLSPGARAAHALIVNLFVAFFALFLLRYGIKFVELGAGQTSPSSYFPVSAGRLAMPVGGALLFLQAVTLAGRAVKAMATGQDVREMR